MASTVNLTILQGETFLWSFTRVAGPLRYTPIAGIEQSAPARVSAPGHGLTDGRRVAVLSVKGMSQINAPLNRPRKQDWHPVVVIDADTVALQGVDASGFRPYLGGGNLCYHTPVDLTGCVARMAIKDADGSLLLSLTTENGGITIDAASGRVTLHIPADVTAEIAWDSAQYDLEIESAGGVVKRVLEGVVTVSREVTT